MAKECYLGVLEQGLSLTPKEFGQYAVKTQKSDPDFSTRTSAIWKVEIGLRAYRQAAGERYSVLNSENRTILGVLCFQKP